MTLVRADTFAGFVAAFAAATDAGAMPIPVGGNEMVLPDGTDPAVWQSLARRPGIVVDGPPPSNGRAAKRLNRKTGTKLGKE